MTTLTNKLAAMVCTLLLSTAMVSAAVAPAETGGTSSVVSAARVA